MGDRRYLIVTKLHDTNFKDSNDVFYTWGVRVQRVKCPVKIQTSEDQKNVLPRKNFTNGQSHHEISLPTVVHKI